PTRLQSDQNHLQLTTIHLSPGYAQSANHIFRIHAGTTPLKQCLPTTVRKQLETTGVRPCKPTLLTSQLILPFAYQHQLEHYQSTTTRPLSRQFPTGVAI
ncbi:hypothetical protein CORC01_01619, partial [Colletotrichum orchidophilum]